MEWFPYIGLAAFCILSLILLYLIFRLRKQLTSTASHLQHIEEEEHRLFDFLHILGGAIEEDASPARLHRVISDGLEEVTEADGAALYLLSDDGQHLIPAHISKDCPPLKGIPVEILQEPEEKKRLQSIRSYLRLAKIEKGDGPLWHTVDAGECIHATDLKSHPTFKDAFYRYKENVSAMIAPLTHANKDIGVIAAARNNDSSAPFSSNDYAVFRSMAEQSAFALGNAMIHQEANEKKKLDAELKNAQEVQRILLPSEHPDIPGYRIRGLNIPAMLISGDYYDYLNLEEGLNGIAIADVSGKGVPAGLMMSSCRSTLRTASPGIASPAQALAKVNKHLAGDMREDMFISMAYVIIHPTQNGTGLLTMARAGHDAPLLYRKATNEIEVVKPPGLAIGIDDGPVFQRVTRDLDLTLQSGDILLLYTDGVNEAENKNGDEFGKEALHQVFKTAAAIGAEAVIKQIRETVQEFSKGTPQHDDITLIAIEKR